MQKCTIRSAQFGRLEGHSELPASPHPEQAKNDAHDVEDPRYMVKMGATKSQKIGSRSTCESDQGCMIRAFMIKAAIL